MKRSKLTVQDMREIAHFHKVVLAYIKMKRIEERTRQNKDLSVKT